MIKEKLGLRIKEIRMNTLKLTQEELSTILGWDRSFLSRVESGKQNLTIENLNYLCNKMNITLRYFFDDFNSPIEGDK